MYLRLKEHGLSVFMSSNTFYGHSLLLISKVQLVSRLPPFANRSVLTAPPSVAAPASVRCAVKKTAT